MAVTYRETSSNKCKAMMKGAVERVLEACVKAQTADGDVDLTEDFKNQILENMEALASGGLRVLALAQRDFSDKDANNKEIERNEVEKDMTFLGLVGLYDPPRPESEGAVALLKKAGIKVHMLTGDHPGTANAVSEKSESLS